MPNTPIFTVAVALAALMTLCWSGPLRAEEPEFFDKPFAQEQWTYGRRLDGAQFRYCVDPRDPDWQVADAIAEAIAQSLLLEPVRYKVDSSYVSEDITKVYALLLEHCDFHLGFKLIPGGYSNWATLTRPYYQSQYIFVTGDRAVAALADLGPGRPIGATLGTAAHIRLVSYLTALPAADRWPTFPMGNNDRSLDALMAGTVDVALVWAPTLWARQSADPAFAELRVIDSKPLPPTTLGVGALLLSNETFLRTAFDEAVAALSADGTIAGILRGHGFPGEAVP